MTRSTSGISRSASTLSGPGRTAPANAAASAGALTVDGLTVRYGGLTAVDGVSLTVEPGRLVGLIGPNGAGKTTLLDALTGFTPISGGTMRFGGTRLDRMAAHRRARSGLGRTWQSVELFDELTVAENLRVAAEPARWWSFLADAVRPVRRQADAVAEALAALDLGSVADRLPTELSHGQRKLVGVARALATRPFLVCLDEPAAGLDTGESARLGTQLRRLADAGLGMLLVDHDMGLVLGTCDLVYVLEFGKIIARGTPEEIRSDERVITAYLGTRSSPEAGTDRDAGQPADSIELTDIADMTNMTENGGTP